MFHVDVTIEDSRIIAHEAFDETQNDLYDVMLIDNHSGKTANLTMPVVHLTIIIKVALDGHDTGPEYERAAGICDEYAQSQSIDRQLFPIP